MKEKEQLRKLNEIKADLESQKREILNKLFAIEDLIFTFKKEKIQTKGDAKPKVNVKIVYRTKLEWRQKVIEIMYKLKMATIDNILVEVIEWDRTINESYALGKIGFHVRNLMEEGFLKRELNDGVLYYVVKSVGRLPNQNDMSK